MFNYVYAFLHHKDYLEKYQSNLAKELPRVPVVKSYATFKQFADIGSQLAALHLNYENQPKLDGIQVIGAESNNFSVEKMRHLTTNKKKDLSTIIYNNSIVIKNIPAQAYEYTLNGKSAIESIMSSYQIKENKDSKITSNPNQWTTENNKPRYILDLLLSIITLSVKTVELVNQLPKVDFDQDVVEDW